MPFTKIEQGIYSLFKSSEWSIVRKTTLNFHFWTDLKINSLIDSINIKLQEIGKNPEHIERRIIDMVKYKVQGYRPTSVKIDKDRSAKIPSSSDLWIQNDIYLKSIWKNFQTLEIE